MRFVLSFAWRDLHAGGRSLRVFGACLMLGVALIAAGGGLFRQVTEGLLADSRALFGGDLEVRHDAPLNQAELAWMREHGQVSLVVELRTMLRSADGRVQLVELQSFDERYPLYGEVQLAPAAPLGDALAFRNGRWGVAVDPALAERLALEPGDAVQLGSLTAAVRARVVRQPDRSLRADWRGLPVLIAAEALAATRLIQPGSRVSYRYRVKTGADAQAWGGAFAAAFPEADWEVRTFSERSERLARALRRIGSGLLLIGFSALFIGGLGVFNSVQAYLGGKLATLATLRTLGLRESRLAGAYLCQILLLAAGASAAGALAGGALAAGASAVVAQRLPLEPALNALRLPLAAAWLFGVLTALTFALPAIGRALSVPPAMLFRGAGVARLRTPAAYRTLAGACTCLVALLVLLTVPDARFGVGFLAVVGLLLVLLEGVVRSLRALGRRLSAHPALAGRFALRLAAANLHRPGSPLRPALLSLGSALTLLVASALVVVALLRMLNDTLPDRAPALAFYDIGAGELEAFRRLVGEAPSLQRLDLAPLVLGRLSAVNGAALRESADRERALESRDEHKLSYRLGNFDNVIVTRGAWWPDDYRGPPLVAMEDREADQLGLKVGDRLRFQIQDQPLEAELVAIYAQRRFEARFWLEAILSDGTLAPFISRYVGAAYLDPAEAITVQNRVAAAAPAVVTVRTAGILEEARAVLARAGAGLAVIAGVTLAASLLVLASVVAATRARQVYDASILHTLGARVALIRRSLQLEYLLLALVTSVFAVAAGTVLAAVLLRYQVQIEAGASWWIGAATALGVSGVSLGLGARYLLRRLTLGPAQVLRSGG